MPTQGMRIASIIVLVGLLGAGAAPAAAQTDNGEWRSYGGDLANTRYAPLDQITADNFNDLEVAWRVKTAHFGPEPEFNLQATPLMVGGVLYSTAGLRRAAIAVDAGTGELLWMHRLDEGERAEVAPRRRSGRGLAYRDNGGDGEIFYVTPGYRLVGLNARTGERLAGFGADGIVDLMQNMDQEIDPLAGEIGLHATPLVAGDTIVVGAAHVPGSAPRSMRNTKGYIRGFDADTGSRKWIFHTIPGADEFGNDTWLNDSWRYTGNTGVWVRSAPTSNSGSSICRPRCRPTTTTAATGTATISIRTVSWPSTSRPVTGCGTTSSFITTSGTGIFRARRSWPT